MTDSQKIRLVHESPFRKDWNELPREAKRAVLDGIDEGLDDERWISTLIAEAEDRYE